MIISKVITECVQQLECLKHRDPREHITDLFVIVIATQVTNCT